VTELNLGAAAERGGRARRQSAAAERGGRAQQQSAAAEHGGRARRAERGGRAPGFFGKMIQKKKVCGELSVPTLAECE